METFIHKVFLLKNYGATIISHTQFILIEFYFGDKICVSSYSVNSVTHNLSFFSYVLLNPKKSTLCARFITQFKYISIVALQFFANTFNAELYLILYIIRFIIWFDFVNNFVLAQCTYIATYLFIDISLGGWFFFFLSPFCIGASYIFLKLWSSTRWFIEFGQGRNILIGYRAKKKITIIHTHIYIRFTKTKTKSFGVNSRDRIIS